MADNVAVFGQSITEFAVGDSGKALTEPIKAQDGYLLVRHYPVRGEDTTFYRTWGGPLMLPQIAALGGGNVQIGIENPIIYYGFSVTVATSAHQIFLRNGSSASDPIIDSISVSQAVGAKYIFPSGLYCEDGLFLDWGSASTGTLVIYYWQ